MRSVQQAQKVRDIQQENHHLEQLMTQMKMVNNWKQNYKGGLHARSVRIITFIPDQVTVRKAAFFFRKAA